MDRQGGLGPFDSWGEGRVLGGGGAVPHPLAEGARGPEMASFKKAFFCLGRKAPGPKLTARGEGSRPAGW